MKKIDLAATLAMVPVDYAMLTVAGFTSYGLRYQEIVTRYRPVFFEYPLPEFIPSLLAIALLGIVIFSITGSYRITSNYRYLDIFSKSFLGVSSTILIIIVSIFLRRELFSSRFIIIFAWIIAVIFVFIGRVAIIAFKSVLLQKGVGTHALVIIGSTKAADDIIAFIRSTKRYGYRLSRQFDTFTQETQTTIRELISQREVDEILETRDSISRDELDHMMRFCREHGINFRYVAGLSQMQFPNFESDSISGYPIIQINSTPLMGWGRVVKRALDIFISCVALLVSSPLLIIIAVLIKFDSAGSVFVGLKRIGRNGKPFTLYKFRSMISNAHTLKQSMLQFNERDDGPLFKMRDDPRITRLGRLLRRTSLDELPQFWNVIVGTMSLMGPRPHEPEEVEQYEAEYRTILGIKPGITGLAQISGRSNLPFKDEIAIDIFYIENWSLKLDIRIVYKTLFVIFKFTDAA